MSSGVFQIATPSPPGLRFASTTLPMKGREKKQSPIRLNRLKSPPWR